MDLILPTGARREREGGLVSSREGCKGFWGDEKSE